MVLRRMSTVGCAGPDFHRCHSTGGDAATTAVSCCRHYHASLSAEEREEVQAAWSSNRVQVRGRGVRGWGGLISCVCV